MRKMMFAGVLIVGIVGCMTLSDKGQTALAPAGNIGDSVECEQPQCAEQWERAQLWIAKHSKMKIQTATNIIIQTYNPTDHEAVYGFSVTREPTGNSTYNIRVTMYCAYAFGCIPEPKDMSNAFYYYVKNGKDVLDGLRWPAVN